MPRRTIKAYSAATKKEYSSWDALLEAEANGYHVIVVASDKKTGTVKFANTTAGGMTQKEARNKAAALRREVKKEWWRKYDYRFFVRPSWKY